MRRFLWVGFVALLLAAPKPASGQEITQQVRISSSPNPVGSGARAVGMGGAFIAIADDATAASWNPGGLIQLERPELSIVGSYFIRQEDYSSSSHPEAATDDSFDSADLNYMSAVYPFAVFGHNMVVSLNFQRRSDLNRTAALRPSPQHIVFKSPHAFPWGQRSTSGPISSLKTAGTRNTLPGGTGTRT
jgi:hypothetical protein